MREIVFLFDGQGAFRPGVGKELCSKYPQAKKVVDKSSEILGYDLTEHLWGEKAEQTSNKTSIAQPAISTISLAYAAVLKDLGVTADVSLGHSLGEATAIINCGAVSFEHGISMIKKRGEVMEKGGKEGSMMAVMNVELNTLEDLCKSASEEISESVVVANINSPKQIVISGLQEGLTKVAQLVAKTGGRSIPLNVGGAWHSPYLKDAAEEFAQFLDTIQFNKPTSRFYSVVDQKIIDDGNMLRDSLKRQMLSRVNWITAIENLKSMRYRTFLEIGPSKILKDLVLKIDQYVQVESVALHTDIETLINKL
jgi:[acyl-carrier-protein] S-malonyltransferase